MSLLDRIASLFRGQPEAKTRATTLDFTRPTTPRYDALTKKLQAETDRRKVVETCRKMYKTDPRIRGICRSVGRDAVKGGFIVSVPDNAEAEQIASQLIDRLGLFRRLDDYVRLTFRDGDSFLELGVDAQLDIVELSRKPTLEMHRNANRFDKFDDPERAFWWHAQPVYSDEPPADALWFAEWQIVHARWDHDEGEPYGAPLFDSSTGAWKRVNEGEIDTAIRRKTRSGLKLLHVVEGASGAELEEYKERNKDSLTNPLAAITDFFSSKPGTIQAIQGDARLSEIGDVLHHIATMWLASPMPMALLGYGERLNRDVLEEQTEQYHAALETISEWVSDSMVRPLLERQWLLKGIWPKGLNYAIEWATKKTVTPRMLESVARALTQLAAMGKLTDKTLLRILARFLAGFDWQAELEALERKQRDEPDEVARIAAALTSPLIQKPEPEPEPEDEI